MRWKLLIAASLVAALVGAGACLLVARFLPGASPGGSWAVFVLPLLTVAAASVFVYRRTARRRTLQAVATALLASLLTLTGLAAGSVFLARPIINTTPSETPTPVD